jgi:hypothetical protein
MSFLDTVESLFSDWNYGHPKILWGLIRALRPDVSVEVGTYRGYGACYMARAMQENRHGKLICIDNFSLTQHVSRYGDPEAHFWSNLEACGVSDYVSLIKGNSNEITWPSKIDFAYIDGWHSLEAITHDFDKCSNAGASTICMDDTVGSVGPRLFTSSIDQSKWDVLTLGNDNGITICSRKVKRPQVTFSQELPGCSGTDLSGSSPDEIRNHIKIASSITGLNYNASLLL